MAERRPDDALDIRPLLHGGGEGAGGSSADQLEIVIRRKYNKRNEIKQEENVCI
jgi:hypothetical protein